MSIKAVSVLDGRYASSASCMSDYFSEWALIYYRVRVEIEWLLKMSECDEITNVRKLSAAEKSMLKSWITGFDEQKALRVKEIESTTRHDVKAIEYYIKECLSGTSLEDIKEAVHFCCTSEDINNLSYALMLKDGLYNAWMPVAELVVEKVKQLADQNKEVAMLTRTHGQPATPSTVGKEFAVFVYRWQRQLAQLKKAEFLGKFNGTIGSFNAHNIAYPDIDWEKLSKSFVEGLGLTFNPLTTQIESHDYMAELFHILIRFNNIIMDFDRDMWTYISMGYLKQKVVKNEVGSSVMPHKVNPIDFENSEANIGISNALLDHLATKLPVSRMQRDLTDSSALRNIGTAVGHSAVALQSALKGIDRIEVNVKTLSEDLDKAWEVLAEAVQTIMRKAGIANSYEKMKELTRGHAITRDDLRSFISKLDIPKDDKDRLLQLTPATYTGRAKELVKYIFIEK